jgi:hypothetical protein
MQFLLVGIISIALFDSTPVAVAHGGSGGGAGHGGGGHGGHGWGGHGGGAWGGHGGGAWGGHGRGAWGGHSRGTWGGHSGGTWGGHGGGAWGGHGRGAWGGHGRFAWGGRGHGFHHGRRFFGPGLGFYDFGYPWWWDDSGYPYYPYPSQYYGDPYYGDTYYGDPYYGNSDPRSSAAKALQAALARRGYYHGSVDGVLGPETRNAIRSFQAHQGLPVTGQVDGRLIRALQS